MTYVLKDDYKMNQVLVFPSDKFYGEFKRWKSHPVMLNDETIGAIGYNDGKWHYFTLSSHNEFPFGTPAEDRQSAIECLIKTKNKKISDYSVKFLNETETAT